MAATEPVEAAAARRSSSSCRSATSRRCATSWRGEYEATDRGFVLARVAGGYRFQTHPDLAPYVERFVLEGQHARLSAPGARDAGDRRLQAADLARADLGDPGRQRRGDAAPRSCSAATCRRSGATPGRAQAVLYGTTRAVPRTARARLARRPAAARRLRARRVGGRGARARAAHQRRPAGRRPGRRDAATVRRLTCRGVTDLHDGRTTAEAPRARRPRVAPRRARS